MKYTFRSVAVFFTAASLILSCAAPPAEIPNQTQVSQMTFSHVNQLHRDYVQTRTGQVHYRAYVPSGADITAAPLMALHLSPNSGQVFSSFLPAIGKDRIAVAPDYPGFGMSDAIAGPQRIEDYAASMLDVIEALNLDTPVDLVGYHTGAGVALEMARQKPDAIGRLLLVAVPVLTKEERAAGAALPPIAFDVEGEFAKKEWQSSWKWRGPGQDETSVFATFSEKMRPGARDRRAEAILAYDLAPVLEAATQDMMIVRVKDDLWGPTERAHELRPDSAYQELPQYGHGLFHVAPDEMSQIAREFFKSME